LKSQATLQTPLEKDHYFLTEGLRVWEISHKRSPAKLREKKNLQGEPWEKKDKQVVSVM